MNLIGSLLDITARYRECPESGAFSDSIEASVRTRVVSKVIQCYKDEVKAIIAGLNPEPAALLTAGGRNPDGSPANYVNWGADFELDGSEVSEISPSFSKVTARYKATDPTGAAGVAASDTPDGCIIGRPWEGGLRYVETPASGRCSDSKVYLAASLGWNRQRQVDVMLICEKTDSRTVADSLSLAPAALTTNPYSGSKIEWGGSFSLVSLYGSSFSPSFFAITAKYRRNQAWALVQPPTGMSLGCTAGVCSIVWNGVKFEELDSGLPADVTGIDAQIINGWTCLLTCNGVPFDDFTPATRVGDKKLEWVVSGSNAQLKFCGEIWREFQT